MEGITYQAAVFGELSDSNPILIRNSDVRTTFSFKGIASDNCVISFYEMPSVVSDGTPLVVACSDRNLKDYPPATITERVSVEDNGFILKSFLLSLDSPESEWVLEPDTNYLLLITKLSGEGFYNLFLEVEEEDSEDDTQV